MIALKDEFVVSHTEEERIKDGGHALDLDDQMVMRTQREERNSSGVNGQIRGGHKRTRWRKWF